MEKTISSDEPNQATQQDKYEGQTIASLELLKSRDAEQIQQSTSSEISTTQKQNNIDESEEHKEVNKDQLEEQRKTTKGEEEMMEEELDKNEEQNNNTEVSKEEQRKKLDKIQQCILAIIALKKMGTDNMPAKIIENLYLGSIGAALKKEVLQKLDIKFILSAMDKSKPIFSDMCTYKQVAILDSPDVDIQQYFEDSSEFINEAVQSKQNILVHCFAGKSRSTTLVLAYLMKYQGMNLENALNLVRQTRQIAQPNSGFMSQLKIYEEKLKDTQNKQVEEASV